MKYILHLLGFVLVAVPVLVAGESYQSLSGLPGFDTAGSSGNFTELLNTIYSLAIGLGAIAAVLVIIYSGVRYMTTDAFTQKMSLRDQLLGALGGLVFLIAAVAILNVINPKLSLSSIDSIYSLQHQSIELGDIETEIQSNTSFESNQDTDALLEDLENVTPQEYQRIFGRAPEPSRIGSDGKIRLQGSEIDTRAADLDTVYAEVEEYKGVFGTDPHPSRVKDNKVALTQDEINESNGAFGTQSKIGINDPTYSDDQTKEEMNREQFNVPKSIQGKVAMAIKNRCPNIPKGWGESSSLYRIIKKESGNVSQPNYTIAQFNKHHGISQQRYVQTVKNGKFYQDYCGQRGGRAKWNPSLPEWNRQQARRGTRGYTSEHAGKCTSAGGFGQLLVDNMTRYQPGGVSGFGDTLSEVCGMLNYIKARYGTPERAWARYNKNHQGY